MLKDESMRWRGVEKKSVCVCMSVYVMCESVVSKQPVSKSLIKDEVVYRCTVHEGQSTSGLLGPTTCGRIRGITSDTMLD